MGFVCHNRCRERVASSGFPVIPGLQLSAEDFARPASGRSTHDPHSANHGNEPSTAETIDELSQTSTQSADLADAPDAIAPKGESSGEDMLNWPARAMLESWLQEIDLQDDRPLVIKPAAVGGGRNGARMHVSAGVHNVLDVANSLMKVRPPQSIVAPATAILSPEQTTLNKVLC